MWKPILAGTAALAITGTSLVYAQQRDLDRDGARWRHHGAGFSQEDRAAFTDARIAALKAGLRLTPDQEKNWPAFETALRDIAKMRAEHRATWQQRDQRPDDPVERLRRQADMLSNVGATLKRLADAQEPLYQSLDDSQKNRFKLLARVLGGHRSHFAQMRGHRMMREHMREHMRDGDGMRGPRDGRRGDHGMPDHGSTGMGTGEQL
jgi:hypothetical protein